MPELNTYAAEFVAVVAYCIEEEKGHHIKNNKYLVVDRIVIEELLDENKYEPAAAKLARWKRLNWIYTDERHITKSVYIKGESKRKRMIAIDLAVHEELAKCCC